MTVKESVAQPCVAMRAEIVGRKNLTSDPIQRNTFACDIHTDDIIFGNIFSRSYIDPVITHVFLSDRIDDRIRDHLGVIDAETGDKLQPVGVAFDAIEVAADVEHRRFT